VTRSLPPGYLKENRIGISVSTYEVGTESAVVTLFRELAKNGINNRSTYAPQRNLRLLPDTLLQANSPSALMDELCPVGLRLTPRIRQDWLLAPATLCLPAWS